MCRKYGFTLVEVLFVVLIAGSIMAFAMPAYKRMQARSHYNAALGTLLDVSNAVNSLKQDLRISTGKSVTLDTSSIKYGTANWPDGGGAPGFPGGNEQYNEEKSWNENVVAQTDNNNSTKASAFMWALINFEYLKPLPNNQDYDFYILEPNSSSTLSKCKLDGQTTKGSACMYKVLKEYSYPNSEDGKKDCYIGAVVYSDGKIVRIKGSACKN